MWSKWIRCCMSDSTTYDNFKNNHEGLKAECCIFSNRVLCWRYLTNAWRDGWVTGVSREFRGNTQVSKYKVHCQEWERGSQWGNQLLAGLCLSLSGIVRCQGRWPRQTTHTEVLRGGRWPVCGCVSAPAAAVVALWLCLTGVGEEEGRARRPLPGGSASWSNLCKRLHTKLMGRRWGPYSDEEAKEERESERAHGHTVPPGFWNLSCSLPKIIRKLIRSCRNKGRLSLIQNKSYPS